MTCTDFVKYGRYYPIFTSAELGEIILGIIMRKIQSQQALNTGQSLVIAINVPQGCHGEGTAKTSPLQTFKGRRKKDLENERSRNMTWFLKKVPEHFIHSREEGGIKKKKNILT